MKPTPLNKKGEKMKILKAPDDPITNRISMGGDNIFGYYAVYRGKLSDIKKVVKILYKAITNLEQEAPKDPRYENNSN